MEHFTISKERIGMNMRLLCAFISLCLFVAIPAWAGTSEDASQAKATEQLVSFPGAWDFQLGEAMIILVRDEELETLAHHPDVEIDLSTNRTPRFGSLRKVCEDAKAHGEKTLSIAFDQFFAQYRHGQQTPRRLRPDSDEYIQLVALISKFAANYGLELQLSLLNPLELGDQQYRQQTGDFGQWMHYREGVRDPKTGAFSVELWQNKRWTNNKGTFNIEDAGVRVFAFNEIPVAQGPYRVVDPKDIVEIKAGVEVEQLQPAGDSLTRHDFSMARIRVHGKVALAHPGLNRVLVVQVYKTPEMDYFSPRSLPYLTKLVDRYAAAGVKLSGLYSDEMHIQQDWDYFKHHDNGEFAMRYVSPGLAHKYAEAYGREYEDFAKYMVYFVHGQEDTSNDLSAKDDIMHVFGPNPEDVQRTALFRARYYKMLQDGVVDLFVQAKTHAEDVMGHSLRARAHATWAESPTLDYWRSSASTTGKARYEYTSDFVWSNTVQQASAACYDYFKWGDFLTGNGNDHAEGGWIDRDYYALALAASTGILNKVPNSYAAHWGVPGPIGERRSALQDVYGDAATPPFAAVENMQHRDSGVLMLYPLDLVAVDERFGSWTVQYGYTDYVTAAKLLERGTVQGNSIQMAGRRFTTLVAAFEPFPSAKLLDLMTKFVAGGGRLIWLGPPPIITFEGGSALSVWEKMFGVTLQSSRKPGMMWRESFGGAEAASRNFGLIAAGSMVQFDGPLAKVQPQLILTDFLVDHIYPVTPQLGTETIARVRGEVVGTKRGNAIFLGYRSRDDQSRSLGYDERNWFDVLDALGAYPATGRFGGTNDNADHVSRVGDYMVAAFPNGAIAIAPHLREIEENWGGGFSRNPDEDRTYRAAFPDSAQIDLKNLKVAGHSITYHGQYAVAFRTDKSSGLLAFAGKKVAEITLDGKRFIFTDVPFDTIAWAPVEPDRQLNSGVRIQIMTRGEGTVHIPASWLPKDLRLYREGPIPGSRGQLVASRIVDGVLTFEATRENGGRWIYGVVPKTEARR